VEVRVNLPLDRTMAVLRDSRVMVLPLLGEDIPCGHVTLVAAAYLGVPTIATRSKGIDDYIRHEQTGLIAPPGDARAIAEAATRLLAEPELRCRLGHNAQREAEATFTEANYLRHFDAFIGRPKPR